MPSVADEDVPQQIKNRVDLVDLVREHVRLRQVGGQFTGLCPFHNEKTPSFRVTPQQQTWHCFGCDRGGDAFTFVELIEKTDFKGALQLLADRAGIELTKESPAARERTQQKRKIIELNAFAARYYDYVLHSTEAGLAGRELLTKRGVSEETARRFGLGFAPAGGRSLSQFLKTREKPVADAILARLVNNSGQDFFRNRLIVPIRDERGQAVAFVGRTVVDDPRKYVNSPDTPAYSKGRVLFALDLAKDEIGKRKHAVLVEGQFDVILAHQFGVTNAIASSGTALTEDQVRLLKRFTDELLLAFDGDDAGRAAAFRAIEQASLAGLRSRVASLGGAKDPDEFLRGGGDWTRAAREAAPEWEFWIREVTRHLNPTRPRDLEIALGRVYDVLGKISDPAVREAYRLKSAEWLGIEPQLMTRPLPRQAGRVSERRNGNQPPPRQPEDGLARRSAGKKATVGQHLLSLLAARPEALDRVRSRVRPDDFAEEDRSLFVKIVETLSRGGPDALRDGLGTFEDSEQELIRRAWASPPPRTDDEVIDEMAWRLRLESLKSLVRSVQRAIGEAEQRGDRDQVAILVAEYHRAVQAVEALKVSKGN